MGHELEGKALGVVGFGRIGRRLAGMCRDALHMAIYAFDPYLDSETIVASRAIPAVDLFELAGRADVVSVHTPLTPETRHLIDRSMIRAMKPGAILVNTSRGPVVDEQAMIEALQDGRLAGAGLDVFDPQPPAPENPLLRFDQVVLTPHVGSFTHEGRRRMSMTVAEDILSVLRGEQPKFLANPEVWVRRRRSEATRTELGEAQNKDSSKET
jgi:phosphoglycerate dehydrogenase-like enzyme